MLDLVVTYYVLKRINQGLICMGLLVRATVVENGIMMGVPFQQHSNIKAIIYQVHMTPALD